MSHYKTLGVEPTATPDQIKQAYRKLARRYHPDMNCGEAEAGAKAMFQEVQAAYAVLSDPERRARYDATGTDKAPPTVADEGREMLLKVFSDAITADGDPMQVAQSILRGAHDMLTQQRGQFERQAKRLERRSGKIKRKAGGENLAQMLIDQQLGNARRQLAELEHTMAVRDEAARLLEDYEFEKPAPAQPQWTPTPLAFDPYAAGLMGGTQTTGA